MPTIETHQTPGSAPYLLVLVHAGEVFPGTDRSLPYSTWIGTIKADRKINVWTPAASVFRGYRTAAAEWLRALAETHEVPT